MTLQVEAPHDRAIADVLDEPSSEVARLSVLLGRARSGWRAVRRSVSERHPGPHLSPLHVRTMVQLAKHEPCTVGELASALGVSLGWASRVADEIVTSGIAVRERASDDRRVVLLRLTPDARALGQELDRAHAMAIERALGESSAAERQVVTRFLERLVAEYGRQSAGDRAEDCRALSA